MRFGVTKPPGPSPCNLSFGHRVRSVQNAAMEKNKEGKVDGAQKNEAVLEMVKEKRMLIKTIRER